VASCAPISLSFGPQRLRSSAKLGFTLMLAKAPSSALSSTRLTFSSSATSACDAATAERTAGSRLTTVSPASGWRTRRRWSLRSLSPSETTRRTTAMRASSSRSTSLASAWG